MKNDIRLITLDLDGTLLNSAKELTDRAKRALTLAAEKGIHIAPCTGRSFNTLPKQVLDLPFVRYISCVNGAYVLDRQTDTVLHLAEIPYRKAIEIMDALDEIPCICDCYIGGSGWISAEHHERIADFTESDFVRKFIRATRTPVPDLKQYIFDRADDVQKVQFHLRSIAERDVMISALHQKFPEFEISSSLGANVEINHADAAKGAALAVLCRHLNIDISHTVAFGDNFNDVSMLKCAGIGVAMGNSEQYVKDLADAVTDTCDEDGVAKFIEEYIL